MYLLPSGWQRVRGRELKQFLLPVSLGTVRSLDEQVNESALIKHFN